MVSSLLERMPGIESGGLLAAEDRLAKGIREEVVEVEIQVREDTRMFAATSIDWERAIDAELKIMGHVVEPPGRPRRWFHAFRVPPR